MKKGSDEKQTIKIHSERAHSKLGASSADRWMACPASVRMCEGLKGRETTYAKEGTRAHTVAEEFLRGKRSKDVKNWVDDEGDIPKEMREAVIDYARIVTEDFELGDNLLIEKRFHLKQLHEQLFGTSDAVRWRPSLNRLTVYDFKYGAGVPVEAEENTQLLYYALGALLETAYPAKEIEIVIVQPRCHHRDGPVRRWLIPSSRILDFIEDLLAAVARTEDPNAPFKEGHHCGWCPAAALCPHLKAAAQEQAKKDFAPGLPYDPKELAECLRWLPILRKWAESVEDFAHAEVTAGVDIPGNKLVPKVARRKWIDESVAVAKLRDAFGLTDNDLYEDPEFKSPSQVEKILSKAQRKEFIEMNAPESPTKLYSKVSSGTKLVPDSDNAEAIKNDAASDFQPV